MDGTAHRRINAAVVADVRPDGDDERLLRLCAVFVGRAEARTAEGHRLDGLPWSSEVDAGYRELSRGAHDYGAMLTEILAARPTTLKGLVAKAHVIIRHQADCDADPIAAGILAGDVLRICGGDGTGNDHAAALQTTEDATSPSGR